MIKQTCCFTGHRDVSQSEAEYISARLYKEVENLINSGVLYFGSGAARGFDLLASKVVLNLKKKYPDIRLILVIPCPEQSKYWSLKDRTEYEQVKQDADKIRILSNRYYDGCMIVRNRYLVDNSLYVICYKRYDNGGTAYTVEYAKRKRRMIIEI